MAQKISQMTEQTTASMTEAGTSDFLGGYTATGGNANRKFSLSGLANYFLNKFKMTLGGSSQTVKSAIDALNSKTNMRLVKSSNEQNDKPWLVLQENFSRFPNQTFISGTIDCAGIRSFIGVKSGNYGCFIVDHYATSIPTYRVVNMSGTWKYSAVQTGEWTTV